jgi:hypothetical protein
MSEENQEELLRLIEQINLNKSIVDTWAREWRDWAYDQMSLHHPTENKAAVQIILWNLE